MYLRACQPKKIADEEGIELAPGNYGNKFHGLLEYISSARCFILYYPDRSSGISFVRSRFTVAHELGHYFLESHRRELMNGNSQKCTVGFLSDNDMEKEADCFAASLLIPSSVIERHIRTRGFMDAKNIVDMAKSLKVSIPCAMIRYQRCFPRTPRAPMQSRARRTPYRRPPDGSRCASACSCRVLLLDCPDKALRNGCWSYHKARCCAEG